MKEDGDEQASPSPATNRTYEGRQEGEQGGGWAKKGDEARSHVVIERAVMTTLLEMSMEGGMAQGEEGGTRKKRSGNFPRSHRDNICLDASTGAYMFTVYT